MFFQPMQCTTVLAPMAHLSQVELLIEVITFSLIWLKESTVIKCCFLLAMVQVASCGAHSEQVDEEVVEAVVEEFVEERIG